MKKNNIMRLACVVLVLTLLSTCVISGTFAKYVTTASGTDSARVAKWGVEITAAGTMFGDAYKDEVVTYTADEQVDTITVQADTAGTDVVAPGTKGGLAALAVTGKPEVDVEVTYVADLALTGWTVDEAVYCPIIFKVGETEIKMNDTITTLAALETAVEEAIVACKATYHTNTDLSTVNDDVVVTWEWPYSTSAENDVKDTALGDAAAGLDDGTASEIALTVTTTITQID